MRPLFEDPEVPAELRDKILRSRAAGHNYDTFGKLPELRASLADSSRQPLGQPSKFAGTAKQLFWRVTHPTWKLVMLAAVGGSAGFAVLHGERQSSRVHKESVAAHASQPTAAHSSSPPVAAPAAPGSALPQSEPTASAPTLSGQAGPKPAAPLLRPQSSRQELAQLIRMRALLDRDPAAAYRLGQKAQREFPRGVLSEEREALSIVALAKSGSRDAAQRRAREFFSRFPESPVRKLVEDGLSE